MTDNPFKIFGYLFAIICMTILPLLLIFNNNDITVKSYLNNSVQMFVDEARGSGYITPEAYQTFVDELTAINDSYTVKIEHKSKYIQPTGTGTGYTVAYKYYNETDILDYMFPDSSTRNIYNMKNGDFIKVSVISKNYSLGSRFLGAITGSGYGIRNSASAAGYVGNSYQ